MAPTNKGPTERRLEAIESRLEALAREIERVSARLRALEPPRPVEPAAGQPRRPALPDADEPAGHGPIIPPGTISLVGRTLVVLGGAYLLRAITPITATAAVQALGGAAVGLAYGVVWLYHADRAARRGQRLSAIFHGLAAPMVVCPLIWETTLRFGLLPASAAAAALVLFLGLGLFVGHRRDVPEIAWITCLSVLMTTVSLLIGSRQLMPFTIALLLTAAAVEALAIADTWPGLRWPAALALDAAVALMAAVAVRPGGPPESYAGLPPVGVIAVGMALALLYLGSIAARSLLRDRHVTPFEVVQAAAALAVGFGGAARVVTFNGGSATAIGALILLAGAGSYAAAFGVIDRHTGRERDFYFYTTFAILLTFTATCTLLGAAGRSVTWSAMAAIALWLGARLDRITLRFHGAAYLIAAAFAAGLVTYAADGLLGNSAGPWTPIAPIPALTAAVAVVCYCILAVAEKKADTQIPNLIPRAVVAATVVWSTAGIAARGLAGVIAAAPGPAADAALLATGRTAVLAATAVALAWMGRRGSLQELTWLVYPVLIGAGVRLLLEDIGHGRPETLFVTLVLYGGALIATPRLMRRER